MSRSMRGVGRSMSVRLKRTRIRMRVRVRMGMLVSAMRVAGAQMCMVWAVRRMIGWTSIRTLSVQRLCVRNLGLWRVRLLDSLVLLSSPFGFFFQLFGSASFFLFGRGLLVYPSSRTPPSFPSSFAIPLPSCPAPTPPPSSLCLPYIPRSDAYRYRRHRLRDDDGSRGSCRT